MPYEILIPLLVAWVLDLWLGDPSWLPHPVVAFGRAIAWCERRLNRGRHRIAKGAVVTLLLDALVFFVTSALLHALAAGPLPVLCYPLSAIIIFYSLAGTTLVREVRQVFLATDRSLDEGRRQVARIVGRDTGELSAQEVRTAALETLAENLSDGVVAPLFWLMVGGPAAMLAYKMVNTQDSMVGYRTERYKDYGCWAARIDDVANYIPARLTALLMILVSPILSGQSPSAPSIDKEARPIVPKDIRSRLAFVLHYGPCHASPNSGWPEAALAAVLDCRFGGPHHYFGQLFPKPYIGSNPRPLVTADMQTAIRINRMVEVLMLVFVALGTVLFH